MLAAALFIAHVTLEERRLVMNKWEYASTWERIVTKGKDGMQIVIINLFGDPDRLRILGPVMVEKINQLREENAEQSK